MSRIWHYASRTLIHKVQFADGYFPMWIGFTPDGKKLVAVERLGKVRAWDFAAVKP